MNFVNGAIEAEVDLRSYRLAAIKKAAYRLAARCTAMLGTPGEHTLPLTFRFRVGTSEASATETVRAFFEELLDQELREQVGDETASVRTLILAHAFSNVNLIDRGE